jgi:hypothetical protein
MLIPFCSCRRKICISFLSLSLTLLLAADLRAQPEAKPEVAPRVPYFALTYKFNEVRAELTINGVPVLYGEYQEPVSYSGLINMWVKPGKNVAMVRLTPLQGPSKKGNFFEFTVSVGRSGQAALGGPRLAQFKWRAAEGREKLPLEKLFKFTPLDPPPSDLWNRAEVLTLDPETRKGAEEFLLELSDSLMKKDMENLAKIFEFKFAERGRWLEGRPPEPPDVRKDVGELLDEIEIKPVDIQSLEMHLIADGQLIWVTGKDYDRILKGKNGESKAGADIYLARIDGKWTLGR